MKIVLITGVDKGIGHALMETFLAEGYFVIGTFFSDRPEAHEHLKDFALDLGKPESIASCVSAITNFGKNIDILINNAGTGSNETVMDAPDEKWQQFWELHVMAAVRLARLHRPAQLGRQPHGFGDPLLVFKGGVIVRGFHVDREPFNSGGFGQTPGGPHQLTGGGTGIDDNEQAAIGLPGLSIRPGRRPSCGIGRRLVIHRLVIASSLTRLRLILQSRLDGPAPAPGKDRYREA